MIHVTNMTPGSECSPNRGARALPRADAANADGCAGDARRRLPAGAAGASIWIRAAAAARLRAAATAVWPATAVRTATPIRWGMYTSNAVDPRLERRLVAALGACTKVISWFLKRFAFTFYLYRYAAANRRQGRTDSPNTRSSSRSMATRSRPNTDNRPRLNRTSTDGEQPQSCDAVLPVL